VSTEINLCIVTLDLLAMKLVVVQSLVGSGGRLEILKYDTRSPKTFQILKLRAGFVVTEQRLKILLYKHDQLTVSS